MILSRITLTLTLALALPAFSQQDVHVANPPKAPALVVSAPAQPFTRTFSTPFSSQNVHSLFTVPAGKRLVIETVTAIHSGGFQSSHAVLGVLILRNAGGTPITYNLPSNRVDQTPNGNPGQQMLAQSLARVRWYLDAGDNLQMEILKNALFSSSTTLTFSGYYIDLP